jgi:hypothetical protein
MDIYHQFLECFLFIVVEPHEPLTEHHQKKPSFDESLTEQHQGKPSFDESLTVFLDTGGNLTHNVSTERHQLLASVNQLAHNWRHDIPWIYSINFLNVFFLS